MFEFYYSTFNQLAVGMSSTPSSSKATQSQNPDIPPSVNRHAPTPVELQRMQLAKLLKDPAKEVVLPQPPKEKTLRAPREMMKNVQGSSAGAGSGEFHVYKQSRRREYERLKIMDEKAQEEAATEEFEARKREREEAAEAKTAKNRAKRQKKKARAKGERPESSATESKHVGGAGDGPASKKRKFAEGASLTFRRPGEDIGSDEDDEDEVGPREYPEDPTGQFDSNVAVVNEPKIIIHDD
ncbi:hypothetical protein FRB99_007746 [Tulasnella sp. 403]|nr:hypothetical protein FRB99_007746 [Tulasnella sp. 403]